MQWSQQVILLQVSKPIYLYHEIRKDETLLKLSTIADRLLKVISQSNEPFQPTIHYLTECGVLPEVVEKIIIEKSIDLIVMGTHKENGLVRFLFGSHTHPIIDKVNCPVLLIPKGIRFKTIDTIVYATDLTFSNTKVIEYLSEIATNFKATISVNHFSSLGFPVSDYEKSIDSSIKLQLPADHPPVYYNNIKGDNLKRGLLALLNTGKVDMIALVHKRYEF